MNNLIRNDGQEIIDYALKAVLPNSSVKEALKHFERPRGKVVMIAIGKAAYSMGKEVANNISLDKGLIITKYGYSKESINNVEIIEAGHPLLDENSLKAGKKAIELVRDLNEDDCVICCISGGGSALFEDSSLSLEELRNINDQLIKCGANINEINTIRKRLSRLKGGKFAKLIYPASIFNIILSDIIGDPLDLIASGPTIKDQTTVNEAKRIIEKYHLNLSNKALTLIDENSNSSFGKIETYITGNNAIFKQAACKKAKELGYEVYMIKEPLINDIKITESILSKEYKKHCSDSKTAIISSGEITVQVKGSGLGGRNQELALRMAKYLNNNSAIFCIGSDGTDGPTDAAGGYMTSNMIDESLDEYLDNNDSYNYLKKHNGLLITGPTLSNVCDLYFILINNA